MGGGGGAGRNVLIEIHNKFHYSEVWIKHIEIVYLWQPLNETSGCFFKILIQNIRDNLNGAQGMELQEQEQKETKVWRKAA